MVQVDGWDVIITLHIFKVFLVCARFPDFLRTISMQMLEHATFIMFRVGKHVTLKSVGCGMRWSHGVSVAGRNIVTLENFAIWYGMRC